MSLFRVFLAGILTLLLLLKGWTPIKEQGGFSWLGLPITLQYVVVFGSPQIFWLVLAARSRSTGQGVIALLAAIAFAASYAWFGLLPGQSRTIGGDAHFEVPLALLTEWGIALTLLLPWWLFGRKDDPAHLPRRATGPRLRPRRKGWFD